MPLRYYLNHNVPFAVAEGLALRGIDVLTAQADGAQAAGDPALLDRATELGRVLFSMDLDLVKEGVRRQREGVGFAGVVYGHQLRCPVGVCVRDLELIAKTHEPEDLLDLVEYVPLS